MSQPRAWPRVQKELQCQVRIQSSLEGQKNPLQISGLLESCGMIRWVMGGLKFAEPLREIQSSLTNGSKKLVGGDMRRTGTGHENASGAKMLKSGEGKPI